MWVFSGGLVGSTVRSAVEVAVPTAEGAFPLATLGVNLVGSLLLGWFMTRRRASKGSDEEFLFVAVGLLGSLTTFSLFSVQAVILIGGGHGQMAFAYIAISLVGGLSAAGVGARLGRSR